MGHAGKRKVLTVADVKVVSNVVSVTMLKTKLIRLQDKVLDTERRNRKLPKKRRFAPYFIGFPCARKVQYMYTLTPPDYPMGMEGCWHAKSGIQHHVWMRELLHKAFEGTKHKLIDYITPKGKTLWNPYDKCYDYEFPLVRKKFKIPKAKLDGVIIIDGELWLVEYKTATKNAFEKWLTKPKDDHMQQGLICWQIFNHNLKASKFDHIEDLRGFKAAKGVIFLYILKDSPYYRKEFPVLGNTAVSSEILEVLHDKMYRVQTASKKGELLPIPKKPPINYFCKNCDFRDKCADEYTPPKEAKE